MATMMLSAMALLIVGVISRLIPALRASKPHSVEALGYESSAMSSHHLRIR
jgi:ABC-type antimicrobial peptide transport system permease subunit